ncbi:MAG TPA: glycosyltransferase [Thermoanaerobaculia bacterium]|nr:glycosyltransferase [Thermoanaerobaculia bacterium]
MRILLTSMSLYPARLRGNASSRVHDLLARGLAEAGHTVYYSVLQGYAESLPEGVIASERTVGDADLYHFNDYPLDGAPPPQGKPWLRTVHEPYRPELASLPLEHVVFVSKTQAADFGSSRYVWNGIDPGEFIYSEAKTDYFLFIVSDLRRAELKGLVTAIAAAERARIHLVVAGEINVDVDSAPFKSANVTYAGPIHGQEKAILLARARALLFPGHPAEAFGLVVAESLISGTPVIAGSGGALPEIVRPDVGFTCHTLEEYTDAIANVGRISADVCRTYAQHEFHYRVMTRRYLEEYELELGACGTSGTMSLTV